MEDNELKKIIEDVVGNNDSFFYKSVYQIVKEIINLPNKTQTTIAQLINYDPSQNFVEPLEQCQIANFVEDVCEKINIRLERIRDGFTGLAYHYKYIKYSKV